MEADVTPTSPDTPLVKRLTFHYDGDQITLISEQQVQVVPPPSHSLENVESVPDFSAVLRNQDGQAVYRRSLANLPRQTREIFPEPGRSPYRVRVLHPQGTFTVLLPEVPEAVTLDFIGLPTQPIIATALPAGAPPTPEPELPRTLARFSFGATVQPVQEHPDGP